MRGVQQKKSEAEGKVLIVDDCPELLQLLENWLTENGFKVVAVSSGYEALKWFISESFDLVMTDICMPGIDGNILAQYVRNYHQTVPIVAVTSAPHLADAHFDLVISKPYELDKLIPSLRCLLENHTESLMINCVVGDSHQPKEEVGRAH